MIDSRGSTFYRSTQRPALDAPSSRPRPLAAPGRANERFKRVESTAAETTLADTVGDVFTFSGHPDMIELHARTQPAYFVLDDIDGREADGIPVPANTSLTVYLARRRVRARNLVAGSNAVVSVTGYYIEPGEPFDAPA